MMNTTSKASGSKICTEFPIHSRYMSLVDNDKHHVDEYPSNTHLETSDHDNTFHDSKELEKMESFIIFKNHITYFG